MLPSLDYASNEKHFKQSLGCLLIFGGISAIVGSLFFLQGGFVLVIAGALIFGGHFLNRPTGPASVDDSVALIREYAENSARQKLSVETDAEIPAPISVFGFLTGVVPEIGPAQVKVTDGKLRTTVLSTLVAYFGKEQVFLYTLTTSLIKAETFQEKTVEFFYRDVVSLATP